MLHGAERIFLPRTLHGPNNLTKTTNVPVKKESGKSSRVASKTDVTVLLQVLEVKLYSHTINETVLALSDSTCSYSWISEK